MKAQGRLMQAHFIEIHQVFAKQNEVGCFSNRLVNKKLSILGEF